jgi:hypothetical protein
MWRKLRVESVELRAHSRRVIFNPSRHGSQSAQSSDTEDTEPSTLIVLCLGYGSSVAKRLET